MSTKVNRHVYTPLSERPKDALGRTAAGQRRKARSLGFKSVEDLAEYGASLFSSGNREAINNLLEAYVHKGEPYRSFSGRRALRRMGLVSPRQHRKFLRHQRIFN